MAEDSQHRLSIGNLPRVLTGPSKGIARTSDTECGHETRFLETLSEDWDSAPTWFIQTVKRVLHEQAIKDQVNNLKYQLEGWREIIIPIHAILIWQKPFYPLLIWLFITAIFCLFYYLHLSILTTVAILGIFVVGADYLVPILQARFANPDHWDGVKERRFEDVCYGILCAQEQVYLLLETITDLKRNKPTVYFVATLASLLFFAWLGIVINNLFLTYILICVMSMVPGMAHRGYVQRYLNIACGQVDTTRTRKRD